MVNQKACILTSSDAFETGLAGLMNWYLRILGVNTHSTTSLDQYDEEDILIVTKGSANFQILKQEDHSAIEKIHTSKDVNIVLLGEAARRLGICRRFVGTTTLKWQRIIAPIEVRPCGNLVEKWQSYVSGIGDGLVAPIKINNNTKSLVQTNNFTVAAYNGNITYIGVHPRDLTQPLYHSYALPFVCLILKNLVEKLSNIRSLSDSVPFNIHIDDHPCTTERLDKGHRCLPPSWYQRLGDLIEQYNMKNAITFFIVPTRVVMNGFHHHKVTWPSRTLNAILDERGVCWEVGIHGLTHISDWSNLRLFANYTLDKLLPKSILRTFPYYWYFYREFWDPLLRREPSLDEIEKRLKAIKKILNNEYDPLFAAPGYHAGQRTLEALIEENFRVVVTDRVNSSMSHLSGVTGDFVRSNTIKEGKTCPIAVQRLVSASENTAVFYNLVKAKLPIVIDAHVFDLSDIERLFRLANKLKIKPLSTIDLAFRYKEIMNK